jgi:hypothetical protein
MDAHMAVMSQDISYVDRYNEDILRGTADLETSDEEDAEFIGRFTNATHAAFGDEDDEQASDSLFDELGFDTKADVKQMWSGMGVGTDDFGKSDDELFRERYGRRRVNMSYQKQQDEIKRRLQQADNDDSRNEDGWDDIDSFMGR